VTHSTESFRVALLAGSLVQGGAEKQLVYMARALRDSQVDVRIYSLTRGEYYEGLLERMALRPRWIGRRGNPAVRTLRLASELRPFQPHVVQSTHFFTNIHVTLAARLVGAQAIGSLRNDAVFEVEANGRWGPWLLRLPPALVANSAAAVRNAAALGSRPDRIHVIPNVLDYEEFDRASKPSKVASDDSVVAAVACRLVPAKRVDRFLDALAVARRQAPYVRGVIVGDGPVLGALQSQARELGLLPEGVAFLGRRDDIPRVLRTADMLVLSSDHEGFPNVILEAMAARLPVVTTPAGDAGTIVREGKTGFVVPFDGVDLMARRIVELARSVDLRRQLGEAARAELVRRYSHRSLSDSLFDAYRAIGTRCRNARLVEALS
jgi:glycosyltransferase involved in cell wall biosynthesis